MTKKEGLRGGEFGDWAALGLVGLLAISGFVLMGNEQEVIGGIILGADFIFAAMHLKQAFDDRGITGH